MTPGQAPPRFTIGRMTDNELIFFDEHAKESWIIYPPRASTRRQLVLVDRAGKETVVPTEPRTYSDPRFSPDGRALVVTDVVSGGGLAGDIWTINLEQGTLSRAGLERLRPRRARHGLEDRPLEGVKRVVAPDALLPQEEFGFAGRLPDGLGRVFL